jgi:glutamyl/glutaminyl-tRNA synthetase
MDVTKTKESTIKIISKILREFQMALQFLLMEKKRAKELDKIDPNLIESMNVLKRESALENMQRRRKCY